ncbi:1690_t:CDS:2, partial [Funneliformis caledonium]
KRYNEYFDSFNTDPNHWSLVDFDLWAISNVAGVQQKIAHQAFYKYLNRILLNGSSTQEHIIYARRLLNNKKIDSHILPNHLLPFTDCGLGRVGKRRFSTYFLPTFLLYVSLRPNHVANTLFSFLHVGKENIKSIRNLWKNKAVLSKVNQAVEMIKAHSMLDRVTNDRVEKLVDYKMRVSQLLTVDLLVWNSSNSYAGLAMSLRKHCLIKDGVNKESETGISGDNFPDFGRQMKKRRMEWLSTPHKPILTLEMFDTMIPKVVPGMKSLKKVVAEKFLDITNEIKYHESEQKQLTSLGKVLSKWLRKVC